MNRLLQELALKLQVTLPNYEIATTLSSEYYKSDSVIWGITNDSIIVNLPVIITEKSSKPYELFEVQTFHVPTDIQELNELKTSREPSSYTKIILDHRYLAVNNDVYILLTDSNLRDCEELQGILYCKDLVIHTHKTSCSCLSVLYWQDPIEMINQYCQIHYFHNLIPTPNVYEDTTKIMLTNVTNDWRLACKNDGFPRPVTGMSYTLIKKSALCVCQIIIGQAYYIYSTI